MGIRLHEHKSIRILSIKDEAEGFDSINTRLNLSASAFELFTGAQTKSFNKSSDCFTIHKVEGAYILQANYCIGIDWLGSSGMWLYVEPKINKRNVADFNKILDSEHQHEVDKVVRIEQDQTSSDILELDYLKMLLEIMSVPEIAKEAGALVQVDWSAKQINISQTDDKLTPFLVVQFLQLMKHIVRNGLKKSYYKVQQNLNNRVKGKILVGQHIKQNVFKNNFTKTFCESQFFGEDNSENRFLKTVLQFVSRYIENNKDFFEHNASHVYWLSNYCKPAFQTVSDDIAPNDLRHFTFNHFFREYKEAIKIGQHILKRFSYNISNAVDQIVSTPPFWIDMPRLFELYFYYQLIKANPQARKNIHYQFSTYGNALDILISETSFKMVMDAKYKLKYNDGHIHEDIRQVAGYARLKKVLEKLNIGNGENQLVNCLIVYPDMTASKDFDFSLQNIKNHMMENEIKSYVGVYKLGIRLPTIKN